jgi:hypothetical protein
MLTNGAETSISMAFLVMCAEKILRLLRLCVPGAMSSNLLGPVVSDLAAFA